MIIDQSSSVVGIDGICVSTGLVFGSQPQESVIPDEGPILHEVIELGGTVGTTISLGGITDDSEN